MIYETRINLRKKTKEELILFIEEGLQTISKYQAELEKKEKIIQHWKNGFERELEANRENICEIIEQDDLLKSKDKIIELMAKQLVEAHGWFYSEFDNYTKEDFIEYFKRKVENK